MGKKGKKTYKTIIAPPAAWAIDSLSEDLLLEHGHVPLSIQLRGYAPHRAEPSRLAIPKEIGVAMDDRQLSASKVVRMKTDAKITVTKLKPNGLAILKDFVQKSTFKGIPLFVTHLITRNKESGTICDWRRARISNGDNQSGLVLYSVDGTHFKKMRFTDIVGSVGDMWADACIYQTSNRPVESPLCAKHG
jgi:hypothetical protein